MIGRRFPRVGRQCTFRFHNASELVITKVRVLCGSTLFKISTEFLVQTIFKKYANLVDIISIKVIVF